jgi:hypothetical protein
MAIIKYVPPKKNILDRRSSDGGYYEAICECCGTEFYPSRNSARYCSSNCQLIKYREANLSKTKVNLVKPGESAPKKIEEIITTPKKWEVIVTSRKDVIETVAFTEARTHGLLKRLIALKTGENLVWEGFLIERLSIARYGMMADRDNK